MQLDNFKSTTEILKAHNISARKKYGQNFLINRNILEGIISAAKIDDTDNVLEIGPGLGVLTQYLCKNAKKVVAVEIDSDLIPVLNETLSEYDNVRIINDDILKIDINSIFNGESFKVVANLPYYITTPIIMKILEQDIPYTNITVMVQKEVAQRMQAGPGSKDYGALSLAVQYYTQANIAEYVSPDCFIPRPAVDSAVISLEKYDECPVVVNDEKYMFKLIRAAFNQRRKTLSNSLKNAADLNVDAAAVVEALNSIGKSERTRGEELTLEDFAKLSDTLMNA